MTKPNKIRGHTLVELVVAATILAVAIFAIIAVVRKGKELQTTDDYRRRARATIQAKFETVYDFRNFNAISPGTTRAQDTLFNNGKMIILDSIITTVIDDTPVVSGTHIPMKKIGITVKWNHMGLGAGSTETDSIWISKWLAKAKE